MVDKARRWQPGALALALGTLSLLVTLFATFARAEPLGVPFDDPARVGYYRLTVRLLGLGVWTGIIALVISRREAVPWLRRTALTLGVLGIGAGSLFLLIIVGLCGPFVLGGYCNP